MKRKLVRTLLMAMSVSAMVGTTSLTSFAAEENVATESTVAVQNLKADVVAQVFDAEYYAATYADVAAVTTDPATLLAHYMNYGIYEGRDASATFNATIYALANDDLNAVYGDDLESYIEHFVTIGKNENRVASNGQLAETYGLILAPNFGGASGGTSGSGSVGDSGSGSSSFSVSRSGMFVPVDNFADCFTTMYNSDGTTSSVFTGGYTSDGKIWLPDGRTVAFGEEVVFDDGSTGRYTGTVGAAHFESYVKARPVVRDANGNIIDNGTIDDNYTSVEYGDGVTTYTYSDGWKVDVNYDGSTIGYDGGSSSSSSSESSSASSSSSSESSSSNSSSGSSSSGSAPTFDESLLD